MDALERPTISIQRSHRLLLLLYAMFSFDILLCHQERLGGATLGRGRAGPGVGKGGLRTGVRGRRSRRRNAEAVSATVSERKRFFREQGLVTGAFRSTGGSLGVWRGYCGVPVLSACIVVACFISQTSDGVMALELSNYVYQYG